MSGLREELQRVQRKLEHAGVRGELLRDVMHRLEQGDKWQTKAQMSSQYIDLLKSLVPPGKLPVCGGNDHGHRYQGD